jgi:hypothetical protein
MGLDDCSYGASLAFGAMLVYHPILFFLELVRLSAARSTSALSRTRWGSGGSYDFLRPAGVHCT